MLHLHFDMWNSTGILNKEQTKFYVGIDDDKVMYIYI